MFDTVGSSRNLRYLHFSRCEEPFRPAPKLRVPGRGSHPIQLSMSYPISTGSSRGLPGALKLKSHQGEGKASKSQLVECVALWRVSMSSLKSLRR